MAKVTLRFKTIDILNIVYEKLASEVEEFSEEDSGLVGEHIFDSSEHNYGDKYYFVFEFEGKNWRIEYEDSTLACCNDFFGISDWKKPWEGKIEVSEFEAVLVRPVGKTVTEWEVVGGG